MDALTTLVFLNMGVKEGNPLIGLALTQADQPGLAIVAAKLFAVALAAYAWRSGRKRLLLKMDILFALCVCWNLIVICARL